MHTCESLSCVSHFLVWVTHYWVTPSIENQALTLEIKNSNNETETINAGIIRIDNNYDVVYYTGKGIREIWKPNMNDEQKANSTMLKTQNESFLLQNDYISKIKLENIVKVES